MLLAKNVLCHDQGCDYPRIIALDTPLVKPHGNMADIRRFSQYDVDVLDLEDNRFRSLSLAQVEMDIFYMAIYPDKQEVLFNREWLAGMTNLLGELAPRGIQYAEVVRVYDVRERGLLLMSDVVTQQLICYGK